MSWFSLALLALLFLGQHTQNAKVQGQLVWDRAVIPLLSPYTGYVKNIVQKESSQLTQGQILLDIVSSDGIKEVSIPQAGSLAMLMVKPGQQIETGQVLAQVIPTDARLQAEFKVPPSSLPYIQEGKKLALRIDAFPYQKFGMFDGIVSAISQVGISDGTAEKKYRVVVQLPQQSTRYFNKTTPFQADMLVDTDIPLYQHSLLESMFEPLLAMKGKI